MLKVIVLFRRDKCSKPLAVSSVFNAGNAIRFIEKTSRNPNRSGRQYITIKQILFCGSCIMSFFKCLKHLECNNRSQTSQCNISSAQGWNDFCMPYQTPTQIFEGNIWPVLGRPSQGFVKKPEWAWSTYRASSSNHITNWSQVPICQILTFNLCSGPPKWVNKSTNFFYYGEKSLRTISQRLWSFNILSNLIWKYKIELKCGYCRVAGATIKIYMKDVLFQYIAIYRLSEVAPYFNWIERMELTSSWARSTVHL